MTKLSWVLKNSVIGTSFSAAMIAAEFFVPTSAKRRLPQWVLSVG